MKQRPVCRNHGFARVAFVIGLAVATTPQAFAESTPPPQTLPAPAAPMPAASMMPKPAGSMMPMPAASMMPMPTTNAAPVTTHEGAPIDALKNNPNGSAWLDKFNRRSSDSSMSSDGMPMKRPMMMKANMMKSNMMKSKMKCSTGHKPMKKM